MTSIKKYILFFIVLLSCQSKLQIKDVIIENRVSDFDNGIKRYRYNLSDNSIIWFNVEFKQGFDSILTNSSGIEDIDKYRTYENNDTVYNYVDSLNNMAFIYRLSKIDFRSASSDTLKRDNYLCLMDHSFDVAIVKITFNNHKDLIIYSPLGCDRGFNKDDQDYKILQPLDQLLTELHMAIYLALKKHGLNDKYMSPFVTIIEYD